MSKKLFVGGLSWGTTDDGLRQAFERFGPVTEAKVILDRDTGRSRGFGFVTFAEPQHADEAITAMDGMTLDSRTIRVNEAQDTRPPRGAGGGAGPGGPRMGFRPPPAGGAPPRDLGGGGGGGGGGFRSPDRPPGGGAPPPGRGRERDRGREREGGHGDVGRSDGGRGRRGKGKRDHHDDEW